MHAPEFAVKHPLQNVWVMWFDPPDGRKEWVKGLIQVDKFDTVRTRARSRPPPTPPPRGTLKGVGSPTWDRVAAGARVGSR